MRDARPASRHADVGIGVSSQRRLSSHGTKIFAKLACLLGERDQVAGLIEQLSTLPRSIVLPIRPSNRGDRGRDRATMIATDFMITFVDHMSRS